MRSRFRGKDLDKDEDFQKFIADPENRRFVYGEATTLLGKKIERSQWTAMRIFAAACYGYYILPTYPSDLAAIQFDRSGTTHIGKFLINQSFILPGLIGVGTSCVVGYLLASARGLV